jgi:hypothetical protein
LEGVADNKLNFYSFSIINMSKEVELPEGVTLEDVPKTEFEANQPSFTEGFVRIQPYNQGRCDLK